MRLNVGLMLARISKILLGAALALSMASTALAQARFSVAAGGNWSAAATWSTVCGGAGGSSVPVAASDVTICTGTPVTIDTAAAVAANVTVNTGGTLRVLAAGNKLTATGSMNVTGSVSITLGWISVGNATTSQLILNNGSSLTMNSGRLDVSGGLDSVSDAAVASFTMNNGLVYLQTLGAGTPTSLYLGQNTTFNMSGGSIFLINGDNTTYDLDIRSAAGAITGGTIQIGDVGTPYLISAANQFAITNALPGTLKLPILTMATSVVRSTTLSLANPITVTGDLTTNASHTFALTGAGNTVTVSGNVSNAGTYTGAGNALSVTGDFTNTGTFTAGAGAISAGGNWTNSGTFTAGTSTVTFIGNTATAIGGTTATTFNNFVINKGANLTISTTPTVNTTLTFTNGKIVTGANRVILGSGATIATPSLNSYVVGALQKNYNAGALGFFAGNDFPVGDASNYTPLDITAGTTTTAGNLTVTTTATDHPQVTTPIATTGIAANKSVNRFWTLNNSGLTIGTAINATFTFVAGDIDGGATTANFIVERYDGTNWNPTTLAAANALNTQASNITPLAAGNNDFAIGEPLAGFNGAPGAFNIFETTTPAGSVLGRLFTERLGAGAFPVSIVAVSNNTVNLVPSTAALTVDVMDASLGGALTPSSNCKAAWTVIQTQTVPAVVGWVSGRVNVNITAPVKAVRNARIRVTQGANVGCSTDNFAIRPQAFTVTSTNATQTDTSGTPIFKTGANFNLTAASTAGYDGTPTIDNTKIAGTPTAGTIGGSFGAAPVATGTATGAAFFYSEVGNFGLNTNAVLDSGFTSVDQPNDCTADFSNALVGGKYGCSFGSTAVAQTLGSSGFGRFVPDNFAVSLNTATVAFGAACSGFSYVGQPFTYSTAPVITVTARNGTANGLTNATTINYAGAYMKFSNAAVPPLSLNQAPYTTQGGRYSRFDALGGGTTPALDASLLPATTADPSIGTFTNGVGALTFGSGTGLAFARSITTPIAPFNADIALALNVIDTDGVAFATNPVTFGAATSGNGISFNLGSLVGNKIVRYGIIRFDDTFAPLNGDAPIALNAQYWNGAAFVTNTLDNCTSFTAQNFVLSGFEGSVTAANMKTPTLVSNNNVNSSGLLVSGVGRVTVLKPNPAIAAPGSARVCLDLDAGVGGDATCQAVTPANKSYLQGRWTNSNYDKDPSARAAFGVYGAQRNNFIFFRENY